MGTVGNSVALYGVELANVERRTRSAVDTAAANAILGPTRWLRAEEVF